MKRFANSEPSATFYALAVSKVNIYIKKNFFKSMHEVQAAQVRNGKW